MKLFKKDKQTEWTEKTAPKNKTIDVEFTIKVKTHKEDWFNSENKDLATITLTEMLVAKTDDERTVILDQVEEKLADAFAKIEALILSNTTDLTDGYWKKLEENNGKIN